MFMIQGLKNGKKERVNFGKNSQTAWKVLSPNERMVFLEDLNTKDEEFSI